MAGSQAAAKTEMLKELESEEELGTPVLLDWYAAFRDGPEKSGDEGDEQEEELAQNEEQEAYLAPDDSLEGDEQEETLDLDDVDDGLPSIEEVEEFFAQQKQLAEQEWEAIKRSDDALDEETMKAWYEFANIDSVATEEAPLSYRVGDNSPHTTLHKATPFGVALQEHQTNKPNSVTFAEHENPISPSKFQRKHDKKFQDDERRRARDRKELFNSADPEDYTDVDSQTLPPLPLAGAEKSDSSMPSLTSLSPRSNYSELSNQEQLADLHQSVEQSGTASASVLPPPLSAPNNANITATHNSSTSPQALNPVDKGPTIEIPFSDLQDKEKFKAKVEECRQM